MEPISIRSLARLAMIAAVTCPSPARAQAGEYRAVLLDASYARPVRANIGASLFWSRSFSDEGGEGLIAGGSVGQDGMRAWAGKAGLSTVGDADLRAVV